MPELHYKDGSFNSTLVQLKDPSNRACYLFCLCFNSTLVQLKDRHKFLRSKYKFCFNSTLVQLKVLSILWK